MDVVTLAHTARENLGRGLGALQTPGVPPELVQAAEPIAMAMSALHRIENTRGVGTGDAAVGALAAVRQALSMLQTTGVPHPAVERAMEAIASSLGLVHQLSVLIGQGSVSPSPPTQRSDAFPAQAEPQPQVAVVGQPQPGWGAPPAQAWAQPQAAQAQPAVQQPPAWQPPAPQAAPAWQPPAGAPITPAAAAAWQNPSLQGAPPAHAAGLSAEPLRVEAALGAHSATNFYKGLSGNDVIDSGGIFIATYNIPDVGQKLIVKVSMPGGYEFEALGEVKWTRDAPQSGADSSPGFGAQFTQIAPEARQLVYRYVRNREPLFHDDF